MRDKIVYLALPYGGKGEQVAVNVRLAIEAAEAVLRQTPDWLPFVPHLFHLWHLINPHPYHWWREMDRDWMRVCRALVRTGGPSEGANEDADDAIDLGIPVFLSVDEFLSWTKEESCPAAG